MNMRRWCCLWITLMMIPALSAQEIGFGYYDVDRLYDTLPSPFYDDTDYTPAGRYTWSSERYARKIRQTAAVIDSMHLPIVALYGVENEQVVRDLSAATRSDYLYLHRTLNALDGMDFALLYEGDRLFPLRVETGRRMLFVEAVLVRDTVGILLCTDERLIASTLSDLKEARPTLPLIVAGRLTATDLAAHGLVDRHTAAAARGWGSRRRREGWVMRDRIATSPALGSTEGGIFLRQWLLDERGEAPVPTIAGRSYRGGTGSNLAVYCALRCENEP